MGNISSAAKVPQLTQNRELSHKSGETAAGSVAIA
jgi:hypothetical protein